jgi:hypothetical protein
MRERNPSDGFTQYDAKTPSIFLHGAILTCMAIRLLEIRNTSGTFVINKTDSLKYLELYSGNPLVKLLDLLMSQQ